MIIDVLVYADLIIRKYIPKRNDSTTDPKKEPEIFSLKQNDFENICTIGIAISVTGMVGIVFTGIIWYIIKKRKTGSSNVSAAERNLHIL